MSFEFTKDKLDEGIKNYLQKMKETAQVDEAQGPTDTN